MQIYYLCNPCLHIPHASQLSSCEKTPISSLHFRQTTTKKEKEEEEEKNRYKIYCCLASLVPGGIVVKYEPAEREKETQRAKKMRIGVKQRR